MWHWDQGHLAYFQFDALRKLATFAQNHDFKSSDKETLFSITGLPFAAPPTHSPWRNYSRTLKLSLLVSEIAGVAAPTPVAKMLSLAGAVTCDEYLHFLLQAFTEPSPALRDWHPNAAFRYPLLFALKYLLAKTAINLEPMAGLDEIIGAYRITGFTGDEDDNQYIEAITAVNGYEEAGRTSPSILRRQGHESLKVMSQISYLHVRDTDIIVSLDPSDAHEIFKDLSPIIGPRAPNREAEILRLASLFAGGSTNNFFEYPNTIVTEVIESGFHEGNKVKKTHVTIERNSSLRRDFFDARPTSVCDICTIDTALTYPWTDRVMDLHHLLPLSSGTRVEMGGTTFNDLVPVCPTCHRAIHRYYDLWLRLHDRQDFESSDEAKGIYQKIKNEFPGLLHA